MHNVSHYVSKVVHGQCESKDVRVLVVCIDVCSIGKPHEMSFKFLSLCVVALPMLRFPSLPFLRELKVEFNRSCNGSKQS